MVTIEQWLEEKKKLYNENPQEVLLEMLDITNETIERYLNNPNSIAAKGAIEDCLKYHKIFLESLS